MAQCSHTIQKNVTMSSLPFLVCAPQNDERSHAARLREITSTFLKRVPGMSRASNQFHFIKKRKPCAVGALWCSGSRSRLAIRRSGVRIPLGAYALRQGILSTIVSLDPGVVNGYPAGIYLVYEIFLVVISGVCRIFQGRHFTFWMQA